MFAAAIQMPVIAEMAHEMKIVPRRPKNFCEASQPWVMLTVFLNSRLTFNGALDQQPIKAEHKYGAPLIRPCSSSFSGPLRLNSLK